MLHKQGSANGIALEAWLALGDLLARKISIVYIRSKGE